MKISEAVAILRKFNLWRVDKVHDLDYTPRQITIAIDTIISFMEKMKENVKEIE